MKPPCDEICRLKCSESFSQQQRQEIFNDFYKSSNRAGQTQQLASLVTRRQKDRTRKSGNAIKTRNREYTREYRLLSNGIPTKVCATMFLNTLGISEKRIRTALANVTDTGAPILETRGRHGNHKTSQEREETVIKHIKQFKVVESHYVRKESKYEYLPAELSVAEMYRMYTVWCSNENYALESYDFYFRVFKERFNLKFQKPKKDKCDTCESYNNLDKSVIT